MVGTATNLLFLTSLPWAPVFVKGVFFNRGFRPDAGAALSPLTWVVQAFEAFYGRSGMAGSPPGSTLYWGGMGVGLLLGGGLVGLAGGLLPALWHRSEAGGRRGGTRVAVSTPESVWERAEAPGRRCGAGASFSRADGGRRAGWRKGGWHEASGGRRCWSLWSCYGCERRQDIGSRASAPPSARPGFCTWSRGPN